MGERTAQYELIQQVGYQKLVSRFYVASDMYLKEMKEEISHAQERLLNTMERSEELEMSWGTVCANVSPIQFIEVNVKKKWS